jgi:hypothetical protein
MHELELEIPAHQPSSIFRRFMIKIGDLEPIMRASGNLIELTQMNFGFSPAGPRGGPVLA